ncbi:MAG: molybdopterin-binding protein, partial [Oscillospiraceae bacterium]|nr:molybdopterin-binding protein [Oscillospiraceae bacterium]
DDDTDMITGEAKKMLERGAGLLVFSGGMSVDPDDVTPGAVRALGADVVSHGVPSQPGNMTLLAYLGDAALIGVPGAAVVMPTTVFDVLLPQVFTGEKLTKEDLIRLGDGGLCRLCSVCRWPDCTFGRY